MTNSRRMKKKRHKTLAADLLSKGYCHDESLDISTQSCNGVIGTLTARRHGRRPAANIGARYDHNNAAIAVNFFYSNFVASTISTTLDFGREYFPSTNINASLRFPEYGSSKRLLPLLALHVAPSRSIRPLLIVSLGLRGVTF
ncbi:hypothetical protein V6Z11_A13G049900 [Gossypium hirsutum]